MRQQDKQHGPASGRSGSHSNAEDPEPGAPAAAVNAEPTDGESDENGSADSEEYEPRITLDRYLSRRRPAPQMGWSQVVSLLVMLVGLLLILFYKDQCGESVSRFVDEMNPQRKQPERIIRFESPDTPAKGAPHNPAKE